LPYVLLHFPLLFSATHEIVFVNFYADWCRFSQILTPVFEEAGKKVMEAYTVWYLYYVSSIRGKTSTKSVLVLPVKEYDNKKKT